MSVTTRTLTKRLGRTQPNGQVFTRPTFGGLGRATIVCALTVVLGFRAGGFFAGATGVAALVLAVGLVLRITVSARPFGGWSAGLAIGAGALALFAAWTLCSEIWSHAPARALIEFDRVLLYLLVLITCGLEATRRGDLSRVVQGVAAAFVAICIAGLLSRTLPDVIHTSPNIVGERLSFPLTYWNAMGIAATLALVLCAHLTASGAEPGPIRVLAAAAIPAVAVTLFLTFSRGGIWVAPLGLVAYVLLAQPRGLLTALPAAGLPAAAAVYAAYQADALNKDDFTHSAAAVEQGHRLLWIVVGCMVAAALLRTIGLAIDRRVARIRVSPPRLRAARFGLVAATVLAIAAGAVVADAPARIDNIRHTWSHGTFVATADVRDRLLSFSDNGRVLHWRVATDTFSEHPLLGTGAGTFKLSWEQRRESSFDVNDAHSLYLEVLSEMGVPGLVFLVVALGSVLVAGLRRLRGPERHVHAAVVAAGVALLIHAGVDWDWEMPAATLPALIMAAVAVQARTRMEP
jgi:O-antigen ligase/polysaccharide polymerase Wzy-like membrane protein